MPATRRPVSDQVEAEREPDQASAGGSRKVRFSMTVSRDLDELLEKMAKDSGATKNEVVRNALKLYKAAVENTRRGRHMGFADDPKRLDTEIVGIL